MPLWDQLLHVTPGCVHPEPTSLATMHVMVDRLDSFLVFYNGTRTTLCCSSVGWVSTCSCWTFPSLRSLLGPSLSTTAPACPSQWLFEDHCVVLLSSTCSCSGISLSMLSPTLFSRNCSSLKLHQDCPWSPKQWQRSLLYVWLPLQFLYSVLWVYHLANDGALSTILDPLTTANSACLLDSLCCQRQRDSGRYQRASTECTLYLVSCLLVWPQTVCRHFQGVFDILGKVCCHVRRY